MRLAQNIASVMKHEQKQKSKTDIKSYFNEVQYLKRFLSIDEKYLYEYKTRKTVP